MPPKVSPFLPVTRHKKIRGSLKSVESSCKNSLCCKEFCWAPPFFVPAKNSRFLCGLYNRKKSSFTGFQIAKQRHQNMTFLGPTKKKRYPTLKPFISMDNHSTKSTTTKGTKYSVTPWWQRWEKVAAKKKRFLSTMTSPIGGSQPLGGSSK